MKQDKQTDAMLRTTQQLEDLRLQRPRDPETTAGALQRCATRQQTRLQQARPQDDDNA